MGKRRKAREMAVQMMYQGEMGDSSSAQVFAAFNISDYLRDTAEEAEAPPAQQRIEAEVAFAYAQRLVEGVHAHLSEIDDLIRDHAENWRLERMPSIDRNVLRIALYEMLHEDGIPKVVILDEAIELAKRFGSENSGRFINGLLDGVLKDQEPPSEKPA